MNIQSPAAATQPDFGSLKGRSRKTQAVMMGSAFVALIAWCLLVGFVASKI